MNDIAPLKIRVMGLNYAPELTGIAPYTTRMATVLAEQGHDVQVLTSLPHYPEWSIRDGYEDSSTAVVDDVVVRRFRHYIPTRPRWYKRVFFELAFGARLFFASWKRPDVVICVSPALISTAMVAVRARLSRRAIATGVVVQDLYSRGVHESGFGGLLGGLATRFEKWVLNSFDSVVVIHDRFEKQVTDSLGVDGARVSVIRNWCHVAPPVDGDVAAFRKALGWGDETVVLHAGAMGYKQDLPNVVEAARLADSLDASVRFVLLGGGSQREVLIESARGVRSIDFLDPVDDEQFGQALVAADILLVNESPGLKEMAVPSKLTSYFSAGRPVIAATDASSTTACELEAAGAGVRVEPGSPRALLKAVLEMDIDPAALRRLALRSREYSRTVLSEETALQKYVDWVTSLQAGPQPLPVLEADAG